MCVVGEAGGGGGGICLSLCLFVYIYISDCVFTFGYNIASFVGCFSILSLCNLQYDVWSTQQLTFFIFFSLLLLFCNPFEPDTQNFVCSPFRIMRFELPHEILANADTEGYNY